MKYAITSIAANAVSIAAVSFAGCLALHDKEGWGWFLFIAVICAASVKFSSGKDDEDENA